MAGIDGTLTIEKFLSKIPPNIDKAELHGLANSIYDPKQIKDNN
jgi:hypothetical protein